MMVKKTCRNRLTALRRTASRKSLTTHEKKELVNGGGGEGRGR